MLLRPQATATQPSNNHEAVVLNAVLRRYVGDREQHRHFDPGLVYHLRLYRSVWSATVAAHPATVALLRERGVRVAGDEAAGEYPALVVRIAEQDAGGCLVWAGRQSDLGSGGALVSGRRYGGGTAGDSDQ